MALETILLTVASYLLGSVPFSYLVARARGVDLRKVGSGNIGGANVWRNCGFGPFLVAVLLDIAKGTAMPLVARYGFELSEWSVVLIGLAAILGHTKSVFMGFQGGKAVATSGGVLLATVPLVVGIALLGWVLAFAAARMASLASLVAAGVAAVTVAVLLTLGQIPPAYAAFTWFAAALVFWLHRSNIERIMAGTERRFQKLW
jgi:glycerol-3-phosphate acyltransferase PlsY